MLMSPACCNVQLLQDTLGSALPLCSGSMEQAGSGIRPTRQDVFEFITQCGDIKSTNPDEVSQLKVHTHTHTHIHALPFLCFLVA